MFKHTAPGGWFELVEGGFQLHSDDDTLKGSKVAHMFDSFLDCAAKAGIKLPEAEVHNPQFKTFVNQCWLCTDI